MKNRKNFLQRTIPFFTSKLKKLVPFTHPTNILMNTSSSVMKKITFRLATAYLAFCLCAHTVSGQDLKFQNAKKLSELSDCMTDPGLPVITPETATTFFIRSLLNQNGNGNFAGRLDILEVISGQQTNEEWLSLMNNFPFCETKENNFIIGISDKGTVFSLTSSKNARSKQVKFEGIYLFRQQDGNWKSPELISIKGVNTKKIYGFFINASFDVLLISMDDNRGQGKEDLYVSTKDRNGKWSAPENLGTSINTSGSEFAPFLSRDGKYLYFTSDGHKGYGSADIFMTERLYTNSWKVWSRPRNMGPNINSPNFDAYFSIHNDSIGYFLTNRELGSLDVYSVRVVDTSKPNFIESVTDVYDFTDRIYLPDHEVRSVFGFFPKANVSFEPGSYNISLEAKELIWFYAGKIEKNERIKISLFGYADIQRDNFDYELLKNRAMAVTNFLESAGIPATRITFDGILKLTDASADQSKGKLLETDLIEIRLYRE